MHGLQSHLAHASTCITSHAMLLLLLLLLLERPTNLRIEIGIEEVIIRVQLTECMLREQTFGGRTIAGVAVSQFIS